MEEYTQITLDDWMAMKERLKKDLIGVQESFVRIGYTLRKIEEQELYKQDGYKTIAEFAQKEHGLSPSTVSRFISINKKYSVDGYSDQLRPEFAQLGSSKLSEMLSLPDNDLQMIQPEATREGIRELKQFNKEEPEEGVADDIRDLIEKFFETNRFSLNELYASEAYAKNEVKKMADIVNPSGNKTFKKGIYFLMMYENEIKIKKFGSNPQAMSWDEFFTIMDEIFGEYSDGKGTWGNYFGEDEKAEETAVKTESQKSPETAEILEKIAPAQLNEEPVEELEETPVDDATEEPAGDPEEMVLHDIEPEIPEPDPGPEMEVEEESDVQQLPDDIPGQDTIENHGEWIPENAYAEVPENVEMTECDADSSVVDMYWGELNDTAEMLSKKVEERDLDKLLEHARRMVQIAERMLELDA